MDKLLTLDNSLLIDRITKDDPFGKIEGELLKAKVIFCNPEFYNQNGVLVPNQIKVGDIIYYRSDDEFVVNGEKVIGTNLSRVVLYEH